MLGVLRAARIKWVLLSEVLGGAFERLARENSTRGRIAHWGWSRRVGARLIVITALAAGFTWWASGRFGISTPLIAAMSAVLSIQAAVHASLKEGLTRIAATIIAVGLAAGVFIAVDIHTWSVALVVGLALGVGRLMGLGPEGSLQIPCTSLVVFSLGALMDETTLMDRVVGTIFGVAVGVALSTFAHPTTPVERASKELERLSARIAELLERTADGVSAGAGTEETLEWLHQSRQINGDVSEMEASVRGARQAAKWGSRQSRVAANTLGERSVVLSHASSQLNSITRTIYDAGVDELPDTLPPLLRRTSQAFETHAELVGSIDDQHVVVDDQELKDALVLAQDERARALRSMRSLTDTGTWLTTGAIMNDVSKMVEGLDGSAPGLQEQLVSLKKKSKIL